MFGQVVIPRKVTQIAEEREEMYQAWLADRVTPKPGCPGCMDPNIGPGVSHRLHNDRINGCARNFSMSFEEVYQNYCEAQNVAVDQTLTDGRRAIFSAAWRSDILTRSQVQELTSNIPHLAATLLAFTFDDGSKFTFRTRMYSAAASRLFSGWPSWSPDQLVPGLTIEVTQPAPLGEELSASRLGRPITVELARQIGPIVHFHRDVHLLELDVARNSTIEGNQTYLVPQKPHPIAGHCSVFTAVNAPLAVGDSPIVNTQATEGRLVRLDVEAFIAAHGETLFLNDKGRCITNTPVSGLFLQAFPGGLGHLQEQP